MAKEEWQDPDSGYLNCIGMGDRSDWREKCCDQCKYHFIEYNGQKYPCSLSKCSDEEALGFDKANGCQGVYEYLKTGVFPERGRISTNKFAD